MGILNIKVIAMDTVCESDFIAEHGLSFLIDYNSVRILFDSGQGMVIEHNIKVFDINTDDIDIFVLSHGHYDHSDGFVHLLDKMADKPFYMHPECFTHRISGRSKKYTGMSKNISRQILDEKGVQLNFVREFTMICDDIYVTGEIPRLYEKDSGYLSNDGIIDKMPDDMAMAINTQKGIVVILGCTHSGLKNTLEHISTNIKAPIYAILGGTHLLHKNEKELIKIAEYIDSLSPKFCYFGHCTGIDSYSILKKYIKTDINMLYAGDVIDL
jgi:7,8-dihydropterin-6-yl-methyl-4-(beta-D-ribofuranosyl)aminobenzene 5'-phosphate synthase